MTKADIYIFNRNDDIASLLEDELRKDPLYDNDSVPAEMSIAHQIENRDNWSKIFNGSELGAVFFKHKFINTNPDKVSEATGREIIGGFTINKVWVMIKPELNKD